MQNYHIPVLLNETLDYLNPQPGQTIVDGTLGGGGHSLEIIKKILPDGKLIGIDQDEDAICRGRTMFCPYDKNVHIIKNNFSDFLNILQKLKIDKIDGVLLDLGVSSHQLDEGERGFSFRFDAPLDLRMNKDIGIPAYQWLKGKRVEELIHIFKEYAEEPFAKRIARNLEQELKSKNIITTKKLFEIVRRSTSYKTPEQKNTAAARVFQGLRIAINDELGVLSAIIPQIIDKLKIGGRIVIISYHSLEDRIVKELFRKEAKDCLCPPKIPICNCSHKKSLEILTKKPVLPTEEEIKNNPRSRSAKLRAAKRI